MIIEIGYTIKMREFLILRQVTIYHFFSSTQKVILEMCLVIRLEIKNASPMNWHCGVKYEAIIQEYCSMILLLDNSLNLFGQPFD